jgi:hypothetical protein
VSSAADHRGPADRTVDSRQRGDDGEAARQVELQAAMAARHEDAKSTDRLQHVDHIGRHAALGLEVGDARGDCGRHLADVDEQALRGTLFAYVEVPGVSHLRRG